MMSSNISSAQRMMRIGLRRDPFDFRDRDDRQEAHEKQEAREKQPKRSDVRPNIDPGGGVKAPTRWQEIAVQRHHDDEAFEPHSDVHENRENPHDHHVPSDKTKPEEL